MNKCQHCGVLVPAEKAFCPNCSEPIEPEEAPNRAATSSSDMMSTLRDDPENYRELLATLKKRPQAGATEAKEEPGPDATRADASVTGYSAPEIAPDIIRSANNNKRTLRLIIGAVTFLILLFVILLVFKLI